MNEIQTAEEQEFASGMKLISQLHEVMPDEASAEIRSVYEDIQKTFRVPVVNFFFRVLANYPSYLASTWREFGPYLRTMKLERAADELRSAAFIESVPDCSGVNWAALGDLSKIRPFTDTIHYILPKLLLTATSFHKGFQQQSRPPSVATRVAEKIPPGIAPGTLTVPMVNPAEATGRLSKIFEEIKERHHHPEVATYYRSLGQWPKFLFFVWDRVRPVVDSPDYSAQKQRLLNQASQAVESAGSIGRGAMVEERDVEGIGAICAVFRLRLIPDLLIDVS